MSNHDLFDVEVTDDYFKPLLPIVLGRPRCELFGRIWKRHASEFPEGDCFGSWAPRMLHIIAPCEASSALYASRIATSIVVWFGSNNGHAFMEKLIARIDKKLPPYNNGPNVESALSLWAIENSLYLHNSGHGGRTLQGIIQTEKKPLTALETDTAERLILWLASEEGVKLLNALKKSSKRYADQELRRITGR